MSSPQPAIPRVSADGPRPFWSVMIPTYNGGELLVEALRSVLDQDPGSEHMHIEVVDDRSTRTDPEAIVRDVAGDRVVFHRQVRNVGHSANFNTCLARSRGEVVHLLHDDDLVRPGFYEALERGFRTDPGVGAAFSRHLYANAEGHWMSVSPLERSTPGPLDGWLRKIASGQRVTTPSMTVRRSVYEELGGFDERIRTGGEDWEMWVRVAARHAVWFEPQPLAVYRMNRPSSLTGTAQGSAALGRDMLTAADIVAEYLPVHLAPEEAAAALRRARGTYAGWVMEAADELFRSGERRAAADAVGLAFRQGPPGALAKTGLKVAARAAVRAGRSMRRRGSGRSR